MSGSTSIEYAPNFQALSLFRVCFAIYLLVAFATAAPFYREFYTQTGLTPLSTLAADRGIAGITSLLPLLRFVDGSGLALLVPIAYPASLIALAIGYRTRWACGVAFVLNCYLFWRNPLLVSGAEILARLLLLWCLFLPINRYWSVDAALDTEPRRRAYPALPFVALRLQISSLYFFSALFKMEGDAWRHGFALSWTLQDTLYGATPAGLFFVQHLDGLVIAANYAVIAFQFSFPYLIYSPWRNDLTRAIAIAGSAVMHLSFIFFLRIGGFPYLCLIMLILLVPDRWVDRVLRRRRERLGSVSLFYEPGCAFCEKVSRLLREFVLAPTTQLLPASADPAALRLLTEANSWVVRDPRGESHIKWRAMAYVLRQNPATFVLGWLTDLSSARRLTERGYDFIGAQRPLLGKITRVLLPLRSDRALGRGLLALNGTLAGLALLCNVMSLDQWTIDRNRQEIHASTYQGARAWLAEIFAAAQVRQVWALFAPIPVHWDWRFRFAAQDAGGVPTDLAPRLPFLAASADGAVRFRHLYWAQYLARFDLFSDEDWTSFGRYLCARADAPASVSLSVTMTPLTYPLAEGLGVSTERQFACMAAPANGQP
ncbi:MAG TPA: HTTM domain-containing protein [Stellaceae bacterium]|jgi:hypothetical protein|nr:HTTM domain-containing protein [Stellaceae bacterium]